jgi:hypothetical protein
MPKLRVLPIAILTLGLTSPSYGHGGMGGGMGGMGGMHGGMGGMDGMHGGFHDDRFHDDHFHDGHFHDNVFIGFGGFAPFYPYAYPYAYYPYPYPYPYPYAPPPAAPPRAAPGAPVPLTPPPPAAHPPASYAPPPVRNAYYFCPASKRYYPYVANCPVAWRPVPTTPPQLRPRYAVAAPPGIAARQ